MQNSNSPTTWLHCTAITHADVVTDLLKFKRKIRMRKKGNCHDFYLKRGPQSSSPLLKSLVQGGLTAVVKQQLYRLLWRRLYTLTPASVHSLWCSWVNFSWQSSQVCGHALCLPHTFSPSANFIIYTPPYSQPFQQDLWLILLLENINDRHLNNHQISSLPSDCVCRYLPRSAYQDKHLCE